MEEIQKHHLLNPDQYSVCKKITLKDAPYSQRAMALLELDNGGTQTAAAELSGLSLGQVKYLAVQFGEMGLEIFPSTLTSVVLVDATEQKPEHPAKTSSGHPEKAERTKPSGKSKKASKKKKGNKKKDRKDGRKGSEKSEKKLKKLKKLKKGKKSEKRKKDKGKSDNRNSGSSKKGKKSKKK